MKLVLDTNVFNSRKFCNWLLSSQEEKYLPAVAYMEYLYHILRRGNIKSMLDAFLEQINVTVVPFSMEEASQSASSAAGKWDFSENARNYIIGATSITLDATLVTNNIKHFKWLKNVLTPDEII
jgi:tRNA(fMet)-specific endonuclease VapC